MKRTNFQNCKSMLLWVLFVLHLLYSLSVVHHRQIMSVVTLMIYKEFTLLVEYGMEWNMEFPVLLTKYQLQNSIC